MADPDTHHVFPVDDMVQHETEGGACVCGPTLEPVKRDDGTYGWVLRHHPLLEVYANSEVEDHGNETE